MHKLTQSLILALALAGSSIAHAATDLSAASVDLTANLLSSSSADFGQTIHLSNAADAGSVNNFFIDNYTFTLSGANDLSSLVTSLIAAPNSGLIITGFNLLSNNSVVLAGHQNVVDFDAADQAWSFDSAHPLNAGSYTLQVRGYAADTTAGSYSGNIGIAAAVPEPETVAMLLAGLGLIGVVSRRRKVAAAA
jgi:hypothetical protein